MALAFAFLSAKAPVQSQQFTGSGLGVQASRPLLFLSASQYVRRRD